MLRKTLYTQIFLIIFVNHAYAVCTLEEQNSIYEPQIQKLETPEDIANTLKENEFLMGKSSYNSKLYDIFSKEENQVGLTSEEIDDVLRPHRSIKYTPFSDDVIQMGTRDLELAGEEASGIGADVLFEGVQIYQAVEDFKTGASDYVKARDIIGTVPVVGPIISIGMDIDKTLIEAIITAIKTGEHYQSITTILNNLNNEASYNVDKKEDEELEPYLNRIFLNMAKFGRKGWDKTNKKLKTYYYKYYLQKSALAINALDKYYAKKLVNHKIFQTLLHEVSNEAEKGDDYKTYAKNLKLIYSKYMAAIDVALTNNDKSKIEKILKQEGVDKNISIDKQIETLKYLITHYNANRNYLLTKVKYLAIKEFTAAHEIYIIESRKLLNKNFDKIAKQIKMVGYERFYKDNHLFKSGKSKNAQCWWSDMGCSRYPRLRPWYEYSHNEFKLGEGSVPIYCGVSDPNNEKDYIFKKCPLVHYDSKKDTVAKSLIQKLDTFINGYKSLYTPLAKSTIYDVNPKKAMVDYESYLKLYDSNKLWDKNMTFNISEAHLKYRRRIASQLSVFIFWKGNLRLSDSDPIFKEYFFHRIYYQFLLNLPSTVYQSEVDRNKHQWSYSSVGNIGDLYEYNNPYNNSTEYFILKTRNYWYFPTNKTSNAAWQYIGDKNSIKDVYRVIKKNKFISDNKHQWSYSSVGNIGDLYEYNNPYNNSTEYFILKTRNYWYFPTNKTSNAAWQYIGDSSDIDNVYTIFKGAKYLKNNLIDKLPINKKLKLGSIYMKRMFNNRKEYFMLIKLNHNGGFDYYPTGTNESWVFLGNEDEMINIYKKVYSISGSVK